MNQINLFQHASNLQGGYYRNTSNAVLHLAPAGLDLFLQAHQSNPSSESGSNSENICSVLSQFDMWNVTGSAEI